MLILRREQADVLEQEYRVRRRVRILQILQAKYPDLISHLIPDDQALQRVDEAVEDGKLLGIEKDSDLVLFSELYFLPESFRNDPLMASTFIRTLNRIEWPAEKRLQFLYRHVVVRAKGDDSTVHIGAPKEN